MKYAGLVLLAVMAITGCLGCGPSADVPDLGQVQGTVTLDGAPLPGASIRFEPKGEGAMATGLTDASGKYEMWYTSDVKGAALGAHIVRIETPPNPDPATGAEPVHLPAKYNMDSTLSADVKAGENKIDFELTGQ
ncbi:MAG: carboxypeptidase regulatory-like domain-containing protein [Rhodopirellula sp.]|nr:carboxypeptidase regulatory-like domain-containing protein [Rhodopirellula sp.]